MTTGLNWNAPSVTLLFQVFLCNLGVESAKRGFTDGDTYFDSKTLKVKVYASGKWHNLTSNH